MICSSCSQDKRKYCKNLCKQCYHKLDYLNHPGRKVTQKIHSREYYIKHVEKSRLYHLEKAYGLTESEYKNLLENQNGSCAICKCVLDQGKFTHVDHDHGTGRIRGLLCVRCNTGLGCFGITLNLWRAIQYLEEQS